MWWNGNGLADGRRDSAWSDESTMNVEWLRAIPNHRKKAPAPDLALGTRKKPDFLAIFAFPGARYNFRFSARYIHLELL